MARAKTGVVRRRKHKKIIKANKGYYLSRSKLIRRAKEAFMRAGEHAFRGRQLKKRDMRSLWIIRLGGALEEFGYKYSRFINDLNKSKLTLDRKVLSQIAISNPETFKEVVEKVRTFSK